MRHSAQVTGVPDRGGRKVVATGRPEAGRAALMEPPASVVAVVLTWNDTVMAGRCIQSLRGSSYSRLKTVVVDNGSVPRGCAILSRDFPEVHAVQLSDNFGFAGGCNRGLERALELGADYIFLLNNDTIVAPGAISELVAALEARPDAGVASAVLLYPGEEKRIQYLWATLDKDRCQQSRRYERELLSETHRKVFEVGFLPACAIMFRRSALETVGLFDESLFTNWEDYDLCCRLSDAGWGMISVGTAEVVHAHGQTTGRISPFITYLSTRNRLICFRRYATPGSVIRSLPAVAKQLFWQVRGYGWTNWPAHRAFVRGMVDFLLGVRGKGHLPSDRRDRRGSSGEAAAAGTQGRS